MAFLRRVISGLLAVCMVISMIPTAAASELGTDEADPASSEHVHDYTEKTVSPTCTDQGYTEYSCACEDTYRDNYTDPAGHTLGDWYADPEGGQQRRECSDCDYFEEQPLEKLSGETEVVAVEEGSTGNSCGENLTWYFDPQTGTLSISGTGEMDSWFAWDLPSKPATFAPWYPFAKQITAVIIEEGVTSLGHFAFFGCENLKGISIADSVTFVGCAFIESGIEELYIPAGVTDFRYPSNEGKCKTLTRITVDSDNTAYASDDSGVLYSKDMTRLIGCPTGYKGTYKILDSVTEIEPFAFFECENLTGVYVPEGVLVIEEYTFEGCSSLTEITLPENLEVIEYAAFSGCSALRQLIIPASVKELDEYVFSECAEMTVIFEGDAPKFGYDSFYGATAMAYYPRGNASWTETIRKSYGGTITWMESGENQESEHIHSYDENHVCNCGAIGGGCGRELAWRFEEGVLTLWGKGEMVVDSPWKAYADQITGVVIEEGVTSIPYYVFQNCTQLTNVSLPGSLKRIGGYAFSNCTSLEEIVLPEGVETIGERAFEGADNLKRISIPKSLKRIDVHAFTSQMDVYITDLTAWCNIYFGTYNSNPLVKDGRLFVNNELITELIIPDDITALDNSSFNGCSSITSVVFPDGLTSIGYGVFHGCNNISSITFADSITAIDMWAFCECNSLTEVILPRNLETIKDYAFYDCTSLQNISFYTKVKEIGTGAFRNCDSLKTVHYDGTQEQWIAIQIAESNEELEYADIIYEPAANACGRRLFWEFHEAYSNGTDVLKNVLVISGTGEMYDYSESGPAPWASYRDEIQHVIIEEGATSVGEMAFKDYTAILTIQLPDSLHSVGDNAFQNCTDLTAISMQDKVGYLGSYAFDGCISLEEITISKGVENIYSNCFRGCTGLKTVVLPDNLKGINYGAFWGCENLTEIRIPEGASRIGESVFRDCRNLKKVVLPNTVTTIGKSAFYGCTSLEDIRIPNSVTDLGEYVFYECTSLREITIPEGIDTVAMLTFCGCTGLESVTLPSTIALIDNSAFSGCSSLRDINLPEGLRRIENGAFAECTALTEIVIPEGVTFIEWAFIKCSNLERVTLPDSLTEMVGGVFAECGSLTSIVIPENVRSIPSLAFLNCSALRSVTIPAGMEIVEYSAFDGCDALTDVYFYGTQEQWNAVTVENKNDVLSKATIHFPKDDHEHRYISNVIAPTCTEQGYTTYTCSCGNSYKADYVGAKGHSFDSGVTTTEPGCETAGVKTYTCIHDASHTYTEEIPAAGHSYTLETVLPTCTERGYTAYTCACGDSYKTDYVNARGHSFDSGVTTTEPGCETAGVKTYTCIHDSMHTYTEEIPAVGHSYTSETVQPTCLEQGYTTYTCGCGDSYVGDYVNALGHDYQDDICTRCGDEKIIASGTCGHNLTWKLDKEGKLSIFGVGMMSDYYIPDKENPPWYSFRNQIKKVDIQNGVTRIGRYTFYYCSNLKSLTIPDSVTSIGDSAFEYCSSLASLTLPDSVTTIGGFAFARCHSLTSLTLPDSVTTIETGAFSDCRSLTSITLPDCITIIGNDVFEDCRSLTSLTLPDSVTRIGSDAFRRCHSLTSLTLPESVTRIDSGAFGGCSNLTSLTIPSGVTRISDNTFNNCSSLTSLTIPVGVTSIGDYAFEDCSSLMSITIPDSVITIGWGAFNNCSDLRSITIPSGVVGIGQYTFSNCSSLTSLTIPAGVTAIGKGAFENCSSLTSLTIPSGVTRISDNTFNNCSSLTSLTIPAGVTSIGDYAFEDCSSLMSITIPDSVITIGWGAFNNCSDLTSITIPEKVTSIYGGTFSNCNSLSDVYYSGSKEQWEKITIGIKNECLTDATIHYNSTRPDDIRGYTLRYFNCWQSEQQIAFFSPDPDTEPSGFGYQVTSETDTSFQENVNQMVGTYVLVKTKVRDDGMIAPDILLGIKPLTTKTGTVTAVGEDTIGIDEVTYTLPENLVIPDTYLGQYVRYSVYGEKLVSLELLKEYSGLVLRYLRAWDPESQMVTFGSTDPITMQVTDETNASIRESIDSFVGSYVFVEAKATAGPVVKLGILINLKPVESRTGIVTAVDESTITIGETRYGMPEGVIQAECQEGKLVLYHIYNGELVKLEALKSEKGQMIRWNANTRELTIRQVNLNETVTTYVLSSLADDDTISFLGPTGQYNYVPVQYVTGSGVVHYVRYDDPEFNKPQFDDELSEDEIIEGYLRDYLYEFVKAYNEPDEGNTSFADEVFSALLKNAGISLEQIREDAINQRAQSMKDHDENTDQDPFLAYSFNNKKYADTAYKALATYLYDTTKNEIPDLSSIDIKDTFAGSELVNRLIQNISTEKTEYLTIDGHTVRLTISNAFGPDFGQIHVGSHLFVVSPKEEDCRKAFSDLLTEMKDLADNAAYSMADTVYTEILGKSLSSFTVDHLTESLEKFAKKFDKPLEEVLKKAGLDSVLEVVNKCYSFYKNVEKTINTLTKDNVLEAIEQIKNLKFEEIKINNGAVSQSKKYMNKAIDKMKKAFEWYLEGTLIEHEESVWKAIFACPIEISVFDTNGEQIGFVSDEECWYTSDLVIRQRGDIKIISILADETPKFVITATDYGTMSCCIEEYDDSYAPVGRMLFYDINLAPEKTFQLALADDLELNADNIVLVSGDETIGADQYMSVEERVSVPVSCNVENAEAGAVLGTGVYARGDVAMLRAVANEGYEFIGWYDGEKLLDNGVTYEFITKNERVITAKFAEISTVNVEVYHSEGGTSVGSGVYQKNTYITLKAYANEGYAFDGWYCNDELKSSNTAYTFLADTDVLLEARFIGHTHSFKAPVFTWSDDYSCYAAFACENCDYGKYIVCLVNSTNYPETESGDRKTVYTATAEFGGHTYSDVKTVIIQSDDHTTHIADVQWSFNATDHWHNCTGCEEKLDVSAHTAGTVCAVCGYAQNQENRLYLTDSSLASQETVWIDGVEYPVLQEGESRFVNLPADGASVLVTYTMHEGDSDDIHTQYPTGMQVWMLSKDESRFYTAERIEEMDDILQYSGSSIRITGNKGIRMITSITRDNKLALTSQEGLAGYKLLEYGTVVAWAEDLDENNPLILNADYAKSNYAYKKGVADPVFQYTGNVMQYTNVLVGFTLNQCSKDIAMRAYMILEDEGGNRITLYGGTVYRSIGYIAYQNRTVFAPGNSAYNYVWEIIHHVYGDRYDADYQG